MFFTVLFFGTLAFLTLSLVSMWHYKKQYGSLPKPPPFEYFATLKSLPPLWRNVSYVLGSFLVVAYIIHFITY